MWGINDAGEIDMFIFDSGMSLDMVAMARPLVVAEAVQPKPLKPDATLVYCQEIYPGVVLPKTEDAYRLAPIGHANWVIKKKFAKEINFALEADKAAITVLRSPLYGRFIGMGGEMKYYPDPDYVGADSATLQVVMAGYTVQIEYRFRVGMTECPRPWKTISSMLPVNGAFGLAQTHGIDPTTVDISFSFADLSDSA